MGAKYLATPAKGRVGKARQVQPFEFGTKARSGDLDAISAALVVHSVKHAGRRRGVECYTTVKGPTGHYMATLYCGQDTLAVFDIDTIEE